MSAGIIDLVRRVVGEELALARGNLLGVVSAVFPNEDAKGNNNYEINVRLKHEDLELRKVPVAVSHVGFAAPPRAGELVLVQFINGDLNQPVITGRFYTDEALAPLFKEDEILFEQRVGGGETLNHFRFTPDGTILLQRDVKKPEDNSEGKTTVKIDGSTGDLTVTMGETVTLTIRNDTEVVVETKDKPVSVKCKTMDVQCDTLTVDGKMRVTGNAAVEGELAVGTGPKTTIKGNEITGG
ncbi:MAG TPA: phage baseplate assembly protein V [Pyrinomonadaceae bacterium]|nr:phage baseplate assembly protein V [Pyrinomonadaceae bacterium]